MPIVKANGFKSFGGTTSVYADDDFERDVMNLDPEERETLAQMLRMDEVERMSYISEARAWEYSRQVMSIEDWLADPFFAGEITRSLYPVWRDALIEIFLTGKYSTAVLSGSTGSGKSFFSHLLILRMIYEVSCLKDPARFYGLATGSVIGFCTLASSAETARRVVFEGIKAKLQEIPYFRDEFKLQRDTKDELVFPKNIMVIAGSSTDTSIIGMNIFGGIIDEGNFFKTGSNTVNMSSVMRQRNYDKVHRLYTAISRRIKSRFSRDGRVPGVLCVLSSKTTTDSFTERIIAKAQAEQDETVMVRDYSIVDVKREMYSKETFKVLVGNESIPSRILAAGEDLTQIPKKCFIVDVPEDLRKEFEESINEALRDLLGISTMAMSSFMSRVDLVDQIVDKTRQHPFMCAVMPNPTEWDSRSVYRMLWSKIARRRDNGEWEPTFNPHAPRMIHLDPASTGDAFGLAMGHISHEVVGSVTESGEEERLPFFWIDFVLRIKGSKGDEVLFRNVRKLIYDFSEHGFHISKITTDTYQSREMIQALTEKGYKAEFLSVDTSKEPYKYLRGVVYDGRVKTYDCPVLLDELKSLEENPQKIDHPPNHGKDLADAVCGLITNLAGAKRQPNLPQIGISENPGSSRFKQGIVKHPDPFVPIEEQDPDIKPEVERAAEQQKVYVKKKPAQSLPPKYVKRTTDGKEKDLRQAAVFDPGDFFVVG